MKEQTESFLNQSIRDWRSSKELRLRQTAYRVPPLGGGSGFSRTTWLVMVWSLRNKYDNAFSAAVAAATGKAVVIFIFQRPL